MKHEQGRNPSLLQKLKKTVPLRHARKWALVAGAYSSLLVLISYGEFIRFPELPSGLNAALSFALALLIGFRINQSYDRWWEARKLWGSLVNASRNLAVKIRALHRPEEADCQLARDLIVAFCVGLKDHLRNEPDLCKLPGFERDRAKPAHVPSYIVQRLYALFERWKTEGGLTDNQLWMLDREARVQLEVCGGCERINNTMMSISWRTFTRQCVFAVLLILPWGLVGQFGVLSIPLTILICYFAIAGEAIAQVVEMPFGNLEDHLDLEGICRSIDRSVSEILLDTGEEPSTNQ